MNFFLFFAYQTTIYCFASEIQEPKVEPKGVTFYFHEHEDSVLQAKFLELISKGGAFNSREGAIRFSDLLLKLFDGFDLKKQSKIDLLEITTWQDQNFFVPRSYINQSSFSLKKFKNGFRFIAPDSRQKNLFIQKYDQLTHSYIKMIRFTSFTKQFAFASLKERGNPIALRGEKIFLRACASCHSLNNSNKDVTLTEIKKHITERSVASKNENDGQNLNLKIHDSGTLPELNSNQEYAISVYLKEWN